jgi:hypothetical protein
VNPDQARHRRDPSVSYKQLLLCAISQATYRGYLLQNAKSQEKVPTALGFQPISNFGLLTLMAYSA